MLASSKRTLAICLLAAGCASPDAPPVGGTDTARQPMAWTADDAPTLFDPSLVTAVADLPLRGSAQLAPWAGNYWPTYQDNINYRWAGPESVSPAAKYGAAFGVAGVEDAVSRHHGVDANQDRKACTQDSDCDAKISEVCAKRTGADAGHCIPTWWGICHAWAPAAILFDEPAQPVTRGETTFAVNDIKALLTLVTEEVHERFVSKRCDADDSAGKIRYDEFGRPQAECIDTNPGTFHLLLANYLGLRGESFVEDRTFDDEVWNQPIRAFRVTRFEAIGAGQANALVGVTAEGGVDERVNASIAAGAWQQFGPFPITGGATFTATMTGTHDADLYVRFDGAPAAEAYDCRPYTDGSAETCTLTAPDGVQTVSVAVNGYAASSDFALHMQGGGAVPADYRFNADAAGFHHVITEVDYIAESPASRDGWLGDDIDRYTHTDTYHYVLESDAQGRVIGGEWIGKSKKDHPDFVWLPLGLKPTTVVAGGTIQIGDVIDLYNDSLTAAPRNTFARQTAHVAGGRWAHFGPFEAVEGSAFVASITGTGDADLYVRRGARPTSATYDCRPYREGSAESCVVAGGGPVYVSVNGYRAADIDLIVQHRASATPVAASNDLTIAGDVARGAFSHHELPVTAGQRITVRTQAANDVDLYLRMGAAPTTETFDARAWTESGAESLTFTAPADGVLHIGVHGYEASSFVLTTTDG